MKEERFSFYCGFIIFLGFNRHRLVIISGWECPRRLLLISSGGEGV